MLTLFEDKPGFNFRKINKATITIDHNGEKLTFKPAIIINLDRPIGSRYRYMVAMVDIAKQKSLDERMLIKNLLDEWEWKSEPLVSLNFYDWLESLDYKPNADLFIEIIKTGVTTFNEEVTEKISEIEKELGEVIPVVKTDNLELDIHVAVDSFSNDHKNSEFLMDVNSIKISYLYVLTVKTKNGGISTILQPYDIWVLFNSAIVNRNTPKQKIRPIIAKKLLMKHIPSNVSKHISLGEVKTFIADANTGIEHFKVRLESIEEKYQQWMLRI